MLNTLFSIIIVSYFIYKSGALRPLLKLAKMDAGGADDLRKEKQAPRVDIQKALQELENRPAPVYTENTTFLYHYNGQLFADTFPQLQAAALKIAHERGDFLKYENVSKKVNKSGHRWCSHAFENISKMTPPQLVAYIEGRPYSNIT